MTTQHCFKQHCFKFQWLKSAVRTGGVAAALFFLGAAPAAASHIQTPAELRDACEMSPDNVVVLDHATKIFDGSPQPEAVEVSSGCTIVLGPGAKFETEGALMSFAGPFVVQSAQKGEVRLTKSWVGARSVTFSLAGTGSALEMLESSLRAFNGSITAALGDDAKLEIIRHNSRTGGIGDGLVASSMIQISGGGNFKGILAGTSDPKSFSTHYRGPHGIRVTMDGGEGLLKVDEVEFYAKQETDGQQGSIAITASGPKALVELNKTRFRFGDSVAIHLAGSDSGLKVKQTSFGDFGYPSAGGVTLEVGSAGAGGGTLEASEVRVTEAASVTLLASRGGEKGVLKLEKSRADGSRGDVVIETGALGTTEVKESRVTSGTRIRVACGPDGSCVADPSQFFAPVLEICP